MGWRNGNWMRRGATLALLVAGAALLGVASGRLIDPYLRYRGGPGGELDTVRRFELGRDLSADEAGRALPHYSEYEPGARKIANNRLPNARSLDPYAPTRTRQRKAADRDASGNLYEPALSADTAYLTDDMAGPVPRNSDGMPAPRDMDEALDR